MKHRKAVSFLCAFLALCLCSCGFIGPIEETDDPELSFPPIVVHSKDPNATDPPAANTDSQLSGNETNPDPGPGTDNTDPNAGTDPNAVVTPDPNAIPFETTYELGIEIPPLLANGLEMPVDGATGFASVNLPVWPANPGDRAGYKLASFVYGDDDENSTSTAGKANLDASSDFTGRTTKFALVSNASNQTVSTQFTGAMAVLVPGTGFQIIEEVGDWWHINYVDQNSIYGESLTSGWIEHRYCFINLPDVIPSILYNDTNCSGSIFVSCGKDIPGVTGKSFYNTFAYNVRLARNEFIMPMLYTAARDVCTAQHKALAEGNCLEIYQTFRPLQTQKAVAGAVQEMANGDPEVKAGISTYPWSISWFIATGTSNHQIGFALDVTLVRMKAAEVKQVASYPYLRCTDFERYSMPTPMHELSLRAASQLGPGNATLSVGMQNSPCALGLRGYFTTSGFTPLASEWWHFNNTNAQLSTTACPSKGDYFTEQLYSTLPN